MSAIASTFARQFFHGTRADLTPGDLVVVGYDSNFRVGKPLSWVYFTATLDAAIWGAELAAGSARERIYVVDWHGHSPERLQQMRENLARRKAEGTDLIID